MTELDLRVNGRTVDAYDTGAAADRPLMPEEPCLDLHRNTILTDCLLNLPARRNKW